MKTISFFLAAICSICLLNAQPGGFKYQAVMRNADGTIIANQDISVEIAIRKGSETGSIVFTETHTVTTSQYGSVAFNIGEGTISTGSLESIDWAGDNYFMRVSIDTEAGSNYTVLGTSQLMSVPFALQASTANNATTANNANHASTADHATEADTADHAYVADHVSGSLQSSQLDYIYAGHQTLVNGYTTSLSPGEEVTLATSYTYALIGTPRFPNPDEDNYKLFYYISSSTSTNNGADVFININGINLIICVTHSNTTFRRARNSRFFYSWEQFPSQSALGYVGEGLNLNVINTDPGLTATVNIFDIAINYVYIRNGVEYAAVEELSGYPE